MALSLDFPQEKQTDSASGFPFKVIFWISLYIPFEEFFLRWLPSPVAVALRFIPEFILYVLLFQVCGLKLLRGQPLKRTPIDWVVFAFLVATAISMIINDSSIIQSVLNMRTIWRYIAVFYVVVNIDVARADLKRLLSGLRIVMIAQGIIGSVQYFLPESFNRAVFAPKGFSIGGYEGGSNAAEQGGVKIGATYGTFSDPAILSAFMLVGLTLFFGTAYVGGGTLLPSLKEWGGIGSLLFATFATKKRAALALGLLIPPLVVYIYGRSRRLVNMGWFYGVVALVGVITILAVGAASSSMSGVDEREQSVSLADYFLQVFSADYWENSNEAARGWFMNVIMHAIISTRSWFGFGPDAWGTLNSIEATLSDGNDMDKLWRDAGVFDDGFWFAFIAYFGFVGTAIYVFMLKRLYDAGKWLARVSAEPEYRTLGATFATLVIITLLYTFVERTFRLRAFSFYFWLLAGLTVNACHIKMAEMKQSRQNL